MQNGTTDRTIKVAKVEYIFYRLRYPPYNETNVNRVVWLVGKTLKRSPTDIWYIPCLLLGILCGFIMKVRHHTIILDLLANHVTSKSLNN